MTQILILAPHLLLPPRNGADLLVERNARYLATNGIQVTVLAASERLTYVAEELVDREKLSMTMRSRTWAGVRTILFRSNFFREKFLTRPWMVAARLELASDKYSAILCSYIVTSAVIDDDEHRPVAVWTHNDEFKWFGTLANASSDPLRKLAARMSSNWTRKYLLHRHSRFIFIHVTEADRAGYHEVVPEMNSIVQPVGADIPHDIPGPIAPGTPATLIFVGSLDVTMNADALEHFSACFWPSMVTSGLVRTVLVVGSNPTDRVVSLCTQNAWSLHANVSDQQLVRLYREATCAILPFPYATGAKLKLVGALAHGLPVISTSALSAQSSLMADPCIISDAPHEWVEAITRLVSSGLPSQIRNELVDRARPFSWNCIARALQHLGSQIRHV